MKTTKEIALGLLLCIGAGIMMLTLPLWGGIYLMFTGKSLREVCEESNEFGLE